jgi:MYXO-CTERM domain-containing protein
MATLVVQCTASSQCGGTTPTCDKTTGLCVSASFDAGTDAAMVVSGDAGAGDAMTVVTSDAGDANAGDASDAGMVVVSVDAGHDATTGVVDAGHDTGVITAVDAAGDAKTIVIGGDASTGDAAVALDGSSADDAGLSINGDGLCSCRMVGASPGRTGFLAPLGFVALAMARRRRRRGHEGTAA